MYILNIVNSFIAKKGNIGLRTSYIIDELNEQNINNFSYSRGTRKDYEENNINMKLFGQVPRILNAFRIYIYPWYNHRRHDIIFFEFFFKLCFKDKKIRKKLAHIWESSPEIIKKLNSKGYKTVLDIPIAPTATAQTLVDNFGGNIILHPHKYNDNLERKSYELVDYIITPSVFVKDEIVKLGIDSNKISVVPFGAVLNESLEKSFDKDYKKVGIDFCFAGTVNNRKGIDFLLRAWNDKRFINDRLHLCGRIYPEIKKLLNEYDFKNVITPGFIDTNNYFKQCDVYVFPSLLEGSSKSIYEAMNAGLPCIVTHNSGSIIENNKDGLIIDIANSEDIKEKLLYFKNNTTLIEVMGKCALKNVQKYSWDIYAKKIICIYENIVK